MNNPKLEIKNGKIYATSLDVAAKFKKQHKHVLFAIEKKIVELQNIAVNEPNFGLVDEYFVQTTYKDKKNESRKMYLLSRSGFAFVGFGFYGYEASKWQLSYITKFDAMEKQLHENALAKLEREYVEEKYLPFQEPLIRASVPVSDAVKHLHILGLFPEMTANRLKGMVKRQELRGYATPRGYRIYVDEVTKLATVQHPI